MRQALRPVLRQAASSSAMALLLVAGPIAPGFDTHYGALKSAVAATGSVGGATGSGAASGGTGAAGAGAAGGAGGAGTAAADGGAGAAGAGAAGGAGKGAGTIGAGGTGLGNAGGGGATVGSGGGTISGTGSGSSAGTGSAATGSGGATAARPSSGGTSAASGPSGGSAVGATAITTTSGVIGLAEANLVGRAFLASPAATRVAEGRSTQSMVAVVSLYNDAAGHPCRVVEQTVMINGSPVRARGNVCQQVNGQWALSP